MVIDNLTPRDKAKYHNNSQYMSTVIILETRRRIFRKCAWSISIPSSHLRNVSLMSIKVVDGLKSPFNAQSRLMTWAPDSLAILVRKNLPWVARFTLFENPTLWTSLLDLLASPLRLSALHLVKWAIPFETFRTWDWQCRNKVRSYASEAPAATDKLRLTFVLPHKVDISHDTLRTYTLLTIYPLFFIFF